jgi:lipopolysaccharide transport system ATP-binding protein
MNDIAIKAEGLGKQYRIGGRRAEYQTLRDTLTDMFVAPFRRAGKLIRGQATGAAELDETIWALKDVSFEIKQGDVVGIIGRNGTGKSTLLKILSRITEPTEGFADIYGRVGSLLEVGTGFHQELTGRENIYLNGAILGMKREEIIRKLDDIVGFAEVDKFIDTPVKHYSSGMHLRLAFAVAAHLEPEILLVDEVLAVGDAEFQKKCLGKMGDVAQEGRTVLFVSHNMDAVLNLCQRSLVLSNGRVTFQGNSEEAVKFYFESFSGDQTYRESHILFKTVSEIPPSKTQILSVEMLDASHNAKSMLYTWDEVILRVKYYSEKDLNRGTLILDVRDYKQQRLLVLDSGLKIPIRRGEHYIDCLVRNLPLSAGEYYLGAGIALSSSHWIWREKNLATLRIHSKDVFDLGRPPIQSRMLFAVPHEWSETTTKK